MFPVPRNQFCAEYLRCAPASDKYRSPVCYFQRAPDHRNCDGSEVRRTCVWCKLGVRGLAWTGESSPTAQNLHINFFQVCGWAKSYGSKDFFRARKQRTRPKLGHQHLRTVSWDSKDSCDPDPFSDWSRRFLISLVIHTSHTFTHAI